MFSQASENLRASSHWKCDFFLVVCDQLFHQHTEFQEHVNLLVNFKVAIHAQAPQMANHRGEMANLTSFSTQFWRATFSQKHGEFVQIPVPDTRLMPVVVLFDRAPATIQVLLGGFRSLLGSKAAQGPTRTHTGPHLDICSAYSLGGR